MNTKNAKTAKERRKDIGSYLSSSALRSFANLSEASVQKGSLLNTKNAKTAKKKGILISGLFDLTLRHIANLSEASV